MSAFESIGFPRSELQSECGRAVPSKGGNEGTASRPGVGAPEDQAAPHRLLTLVARGISLMPESLPRNLEKGKSSPKGRKILATDNHAAEQDARNALKAEIADKLRVIAGTPERPVQAAIERARQALRWRSYHYVEDLWYGEIENIPGHLCRQIDALAAKAAAREISDLEERLQALRRLERAGLEPA